MTKYTAIICQACHGALLIDTDQEPSELNKQLAAIGWKIPFEGAGWTCCDLPIAKPVRAKITAFVRYEAGKPFAFKVGVEAALLGYDCISRNDDYIKGHALGMSMRQVAQNSVMRFEDDN